LGSGRFGVGRTGFDGGGIAFDAGEKEGARARARWLGVGMVEVVWMFESFCVVIRMWWIG